MDNLQKAEMWELFKALEAKAIQMNHYDLARVTTQKDVQLWKQFLTDPEVTAYIDQEAQILTQSELRKLASDVSDSRSVGQAQLINAMSKLTDTKTTKEGPIFIYTYVPLSSSQEKAANIEVAPEDVFEIPELVEPEVETGIEIEDEDDLF
jgi:hypothetical protein